MRMIHAHESGSLPCCDSTTPPKRATNPSLNAKVLELARELGMNPSQTGDALLAGEVRRRYSEKWNAGNRAAGAACHARVKTQGLPLAKHRGFMKAH
jgi:antitoxin CcdA